MATQLNAILTVHTGTAAKWAVTTYKLKKGEIGLETDTGKFKFGNGVDLWPDLPYAVDRAAEISLADLISDSQHRTVTDEQISLWTSYGSSKQDKLTFAEDNVSLNDTRIPNSHAVATSISELANNVTSQLANFYTKTQIDSNHYNKSTIDTKLDELSNSISAIPKFEIKVVQSLPTSNISTTTVYLVTSSTENQNLYTEYIYANSKWEKIGTQTISLAGYATETWAQTLVNQSIANFLTESQINTKITEALTPYAKASDITDVLEDYIRKSADVDSSPTSGSNNPVSSGGVYTELAKKQNTLTFDDTPRSNSGNPVSSDGIYTALATKQNTLTFDSEPKSNSANPVTSGGVFAALAAKMAEAVKYSDEIIINGGEL